MYIFLFSRRIGKCYINTHGGTFRENSKWWDFNNTGLGCRTPCCRIIVSKDFHGFKKLVKQLNSSCYQNPNTVLHLTIWQPEICEHSKLGMFGCVFMFLHALGNLDIGGYCRMLRYMIFNLGATFWWLKILDMEANNIYNYSSISWFCFVENTLAFNS